MEWFRQLGRAIRNLSRIARQNPIWAITALVVSPIRLIRHLFAVLILFLAAGIVLGLGMPLILGKLLGLPHDSNLYQIIMMLTVIVVILIGLRALFQPLILAYGGPAADDTHGSARFATDAENRAYAGDSGLLIGRDRKTGRPLRYAGPAHLLTIAPTRTGRAMRSSVKEREIHKPKSWPAPSRRNSRSCFLPRNSAFPFPWPSGNLEPRGMQNGSFTRSYLPGGMPGGSVPRQSSGSCMGEGCRPSRLPVACESPPPPTWMGYWMIRDGRPPRRWT